METPEFQSPSLSTNFVTMFLLKIPREFSVLNRSTRDTRTGFPLTDPSSPT